jgi:hypothetical protein
MKIFGIILIVFISFNGFSHKGKKLRKNLYGQNTALKKTWTVRYSMG